MKNKERQTTGALVAAGLLLGLTVLGAGSPQQAGSTGAAAQPSAQGQPKVTDAAQIVGSMSELMVHLIHPTSDAVFYISSRTPRTDAEWAELQAKTLTLAESANLLMMPARARGRAQWIEDSKLMLDAGMAAFKAAKARDVAALEGVSDQLYESCTTCHQHFRPDYGKKPPG